MKKVLLFFIPLFILAIPLLAFANTSSPDESYSFTFMWAIIAVPIIFVVIIIIISIIYIRKFIKRRKANLNEGNDDTFKKLNL